VISLAKTPCLGNHQALAVIEDDLTTMPTPPLSQLVTLFTTCKPFAGEATILQMNALRSWQLLGLPIIICGDEEGAKEAAIEVGAFHVSAIERNDKGTPYILSIFNEAAKAATTPFLAYVNADILLRADIAEAMLRFFGHKRATDKFLLTFRRRNIPLGESLPTDAADAIATLTTLDQKYGSWDQSNAIDLFLFSRDLFGEIIPLVVGHMQWDNWLLWRAHTLGADVIDGSIEAALLHPIHGYESDGTGLNERTQGTQAVKNRQLVAGNLMNLTAATTHVLLGGETVPISAPTKKQLEAHCKPDAIREFWAGLHYLDYAKDRRTVAELLDCCRTILWRHERFYPLFENAPPAEDKLNQMLFAAFATRDEADMHAAADAVQDLVCLAFLDRLKTVSEATRPIYIWGCGAAGQRMARYLIRHDVGVRGFLDRDPAKTGTKVGELLVVGNNIPETEAGAAPYLLIASMHASEIAENFEKKGLKKHQDFSG